MAERLSDKEEVDGSIPSTPTKTSGPWLSWQSASFAMRRSPVQIRQGPHMKSVVICGSRRFKSEIREFAAKLRALNVIVFEPYLHSGQKEWEELSEEYRRFIALGLTHDHFYKIRMADVVFIYNKDGYSGNSTTLEIGFAMALGKPIYALSDNDEELCRRVLFRDFVSSPEKLIQKLI